MFVRVERYMGKRGDRKERRKKVERERETEGTTYDVIDKAPH